MERLIGIAGILVLLSIALAMSNNRKAISWQLVTWGLGIQLLFAIIILKTPVGVPFFGAIDIGIKYLLSFSDAGSDFLFKSFRRGVVEDPLMNFFAYCSLLSFRYYAVNSKMDCPYHAEINGHQRI